MPRGRFLLIACAIAATTVAESAPRQKPSAPGSDPRGAMPEQDEYRSCDVSVREYVQGRMEATALPVKEIKADGLRMTLNFVHPYGESGDTPPNLAFTRGESVEERRKALNEAKQRVRLLEEAAKTSNVWYVISLTKDEPNGLDGRRGPANAQPEPKGLSATAAVFANIENRCVNVYEYKSVPLESLSQELRTLLGGKEPKRPSGDTPAAGPPS